MLMNNLYPDIIMFLSLRYKSKKVNTLIMLNVLRITESDSVVSVQEETEPMFNFGKNRDN